MYQVIAGCHELLWRQDSCLLELGLLTSCQRLQRQLGVEAHPKDGGQVGHDPKGRGLEGVDDVTHDGKRLTHTHTRRQARDACWQQLLTKRHAWTEAGE